jgi:hypothetical protein
MVLFFARVYSVSLFARWSISGTDDRPYAYPTSPNPLGILTYLAHAFPGPSQSYMAPLARAIRHSRCWLLGDGRVSGLQLGKVGEITVYGP